MKRRAIVGKRYRVPCVRVFGWDGWIPVLGPEHDDIEIVGFDKRHFHYDVRFLTSGQMCRARGSREDHFALGAVVNAAEVSDGPKPRLKKCRRVMPTFPLKVPSDVGGETVPWLGELERAYSGMRLNLDCMVCPHRGLPLQGLPVKDGVVVCPGHGLAWNVATGELSPRIAAAMETGGVKC